MDALEATTLRADVEGRLRPICSDWPEPLFQEVVSKIVEFTIKYERRAATSLLPPALAVTATEALIADLKDIVERSAEVREKGPTQDAPPPAG